MGAEGATGGVTGVQLRDHVRAVPEFVEVQGCFIAIGHHPNTNLFVGQLAMDDASYLLTHRGTHLNVEGVFAAGDATDFAVKHGGISAQQADTAAAGIGHLAGFEFRRERQPFGRFMGPDDIRRINPFNATDVLQQMPMVQLMPGESRFDRIVLERYPNYWNKGQIHFERIVYQPIVDATVRRLRPIVLTAAAAVLAMIPLSRSEFFGPMAVAIMGGLIAATLLTLLFVPALYAAWFRVPPTGSR